MQQNLQTNIEANIKLDAIEKQLKNINKNLLNVFWIVGFFAFLYFGLMIWDLCTSCGNWSKLSHEMR